MAVRYARPRLLSSDDKHYRQYVEQYLLQRQNNRAMRPPRQRDLFGGQAEQALRGWLGTQLDLAETRILGYEELRGRRGTQRYRELDALTVLDRRTVHVFEIKASRTASAIRRAYAQLQETRAILRLLYPTVYATILLVDTGILSADAIIALMDQDDAPRVPPETLAEVLATLPTLHPIASLADSPQDANGVDLLQFSVDDIIALAGAENLALDWEADELAADEPFVASPPSLAYTTEPEPPASPEPDHPQVDASLAEDDESPFAAALRRAGLSPSAPAQE